MKIFERGLFFAVYVARTLGAAPAVPKHLCLLCKLNVRRNEGYRTPVGRLEGGLAPKNCFKVIFFDTFFDTLDTFAQKIYCYLYGKDAVNKTLLLSLNGQAGVLFMASYFFCLF